MVQVYEKSELEEFVEQEEIFVVIPEEKTSVDKKEELQTPKKLRLYRKHKKTIGIDKVKKNIHAQMYTNRFVIR